MSIMEVLTLLLVLFAALSYIDIIKEDKHPYPEKVGCLSLELAKILLRVYRNIVSD